MYEDVKYILIFNAWDGDRFIPCSSKEELEMKKIEYSIYEHVTVFEVIKELN